MEVARRSTTMKSPAINRRDFLALTGAGAFGACISGVPRFARAGELVGWHPGPDVIVVNANVFTVDARLPRAEAFAISAGRFQAVGTSQDIRNLARRGTQV